MSELAKLIAVKRQGRRATIEIDGEEFPWYVAENGIEARVGGPGDMPTVQLTLMAERVEVVNSLDPADG